MPQDAHTAVQVPVELQQKFPELIALILGSESMNDEERQYWINILPIMNEEQIQNLQGILDNEKKQLAAIDKKYEKEIEQIGSGELVRQTEELRRKRQQELHKQEAKAEQKEDEQTEDILKQIENL